MSVYGTEEHKQGNDQRENVIKPGVSRFQQRSHTKPDDQEFSLVGLELLLQLDAAYPDSIVTPSPSNENVLGNMLSFLGDQGVIVTSGIDHQITDAGRQSLHLALASWPKDEAASPEAFRPPNSAQASNIMLSILRAHYDLRPDMA